MTTNALTDLLRRLPAQAQAQLMGGKLGALTGAIMHAPTAIHNNVDRLLGVARSIPGNVSQLMHHPQAYAQQAMHHINAKAGANLKLLQLLGDPRVPEDVKNEISLKLFMPFVGFTGAGLEAGLEDRVASIGG